MKNFLILFIILLCCDKPSFEKATQKTELQNNKQQFEEVAPTITNFELIHMEKGQLRWKIKAKKAVVDQKKNFLTITDGYLKLFENKLALADVKFELAQYNMEDELLIFFGRNLITTVEKEKIITYDIKYIHKENKIYSEKEIEIYKDGNVIKGVGFETFDGFQTIRIYKNVIESQ